MLLGSMDWVHRPATKDESRGRVTVVVCRSPSGLFLDVIIIHRIVPCVHYS